RVPPGGGCRQPAHVLTHRPGGYPPLRDGLVWTAIFALRSPARRPVPALPPPPAGSRHAPPHRPRRPCPPAVGSGGGREGAESGTAPSGGRRPRRLGPRTHRPRRGS